MSLGLTNASTPEQVAAALIGECRRRNYSRDECIAVDSTLRQESGLRMVWSANRQWFGYAQQDASYPNRMDPNGNLLGFLDRLDGKRKSSGASPDPFKNIFWLQQRPSESSADEAFNDPTARRAYYDEIRRHIAAATADYDRFSGGAPAPPPPAPATYGLPPNSNSGGYGGNGVRFPDWVYALGNAFGIKPSTYPGHQTGNRNEAGYAPNPQGLNRGIDWAAPGTPDQWDRLTRFADYLATIPQYLEQVIWQNPHTMRSIEVAGGRHQPGYFRNDLAGHRDHVHTRQSRPIPVPGATQPPPPPPLVKPKFEERQMIGWGSSKRSRPPTNFLLHTQQPLSDATAEDLARYCQGQNEVSYHFTGRDGIVYDVVPTELASWSVLEANMFTINFCFAGSAAEMSRQQWIDRYARDIEIAAYIGVREARRYNFSTEVLVPQLHRQGKDVYAGEPRPGISDHNYVTRELGIGSHTDVGPGFPWDIFVAHVNKYAGRQGDDDEMSAADVARLEGKIDRILREQTQKHPSRSQVREPGEREVDTWAGMDLNTDGNVDLMATFLRALLKSPNAKARLERVAAGVEPGRSQDDPLIAQQMLVTVGRIHRLIESGPQPSTGGSITAGPSANEVATAVVAALPTPAPTPAHTSEIDSLLTQNARLREQLAEVQQLLIAQANRPSSEPSTALEPVNGATWGDTAKGVVNSVQKWTELLMAMDAKERQGLSVAMQALNLPIEGAKK
jgi:hypothetical protein